jgi:preprotein translocase subunit YajC
MWLISDAWAQDTAAQPNPLYQVAFMLVMVAVLYLLLIRPQQKRAKEQRAMMEALKSGDEVVTSGGVLGRIAEVGDVFVTVEIADGVRIQVQKHMIGALMPKGTMSKAMVKNK